MVISPAPKPSRPPAFRRPISSEKYENDSRPIKPDTESRISIFEASCGDTFNISTNSEGAHKARPYTPVCAPALPSHETIRLRGYLKRSSQLLTTTGPASAALGNGNVDGSICSAQASDLRASSYRPCRHSQRGDSGTQSLTNRTSSAG